MSIPSYQVKVNQTVSFLKDKSLKIPYIEKSIANEVILAGMAREKSCRWKINQRANK